MYLILTKEEFHKLIDLGYKSTFNFQSYKSSDNRLYYYCSNPEKCPILKTLSEIWIKDGQTDLMQFLNSFKNIDQIKNLGKIIGDKDDN